MIGIVYGVLLGTLLAFINAPANLSIRRIEMNSQTAKYSFPLFGPYRIHGKHPEDFEDFCEFQLKFRPGEDQLTAKVDQNGNLAIQGTLRTKNNIEYRFETATLSLNREKSSFNNIAFTTVRVEGISYSFKGQFLERPQLKEGMYIELVGALTKFSHEQRVAKADLDFVNWTYE